MRGKGRVLSIALGAMVSGCLSGDDVFGVFADGYPDVAYGVANAADWSGAETVVVDLAEFAFSPETLEFETGRPYALNLTNTGVLTHRFVAHGFFRAIAARRLVYSDAEASYPLLEAIVLKPGETKAVHFVPITPGDYELTCDLPFHGMLGMSGRILIE